MLLNSFSSYSSGGVSGLSIIDVNGLQGLKNSRNVYDYTSTTTINTAYDDNDSIPLHEIINVTGSGILFASRMKATYTIGSDLTHTGSIDRKFGMNSSLTIDGTVIMKRVLNDDYTISIGGTNASPGPGDSNNVSERYFYASSIDNVSYDNSFSYGLDYLSTEMRTANGDSLYFSSEDIGKSISYAHFGSYDYPQKLEFPIYFDNGFSIRVGYGFLKGDRYEHRKNDLDALKIILDTRYILL